MRRTKPLCPRGPPSWLDGVVRLVSPDTRERERRRPPHEDGGGQHSSLTLKWRLTGERDPKDSDNKSICRCARHEGKRACRTPHEYVAT